MRKEELTLLRAALLISTYCLAPTALSADNRALGLARRRELADEARLLAQAQLARFGPDYAARIDAQRHIVYTSALDEKNFDRAVRTLAAYTDAQRKFLFPHEFRWNVKVVLPTVSDYRKHVPAARAKALGFYHPTTRTLTSISLSSVLVHEYTHALHHNDQALAGQVHAIWVVEGLAMLFQDCLPNSGDLKPTTCSLLPDLRTAVQEDKALDLSVLLAMDPKAFMEQSKLAYSQSRYLMLYLFERGVLKDFYRTYKATYAEDRTGKKALEQTVHKPLSLIEREWREWLGGLEMPWRPGRPGKTHLGIRMEHDRQGVRVTGFVKQSAAERAKLLQVGDVVISLAGQPTPTPADLTRAVQAHRPGQTIDIEVVRGSGTVTIQHMLGVAPRIRP